MNTVNLESAASAARQLSTDLFSNDTTECVSQATARLVNDDTATSCLEAERLRTLTRAEIGYGWTRRPFFAYDRSRLCGACRAYWLAELLAQELHALLCLAKLAQAAAQDAFDPVI